MEKGLSRERRPESDERGRRPGDRHGAGALCRVRAGRIPRGITASVQTIRDHHRGVRHDLRIRGLDAQPGPLRLILKPDMARAEDCQMVQSAIRWTQLRYVETHGTLTCPVFRPGRIAAALF